MSYQIRVILGGVVAVLAFDVLASLASQRLGFTYALASLGSSVIYFVIGFLVVRGSPNARVRDAAAAAAIAGLVDASAGWAISWQIGPGKLLDGGALTATRWVGTACFAVALAAAVGAFGSVVGRPRPSIDAPTA